MFSPSRSVTHPAGMVISPIQFLMVKNNTISAQTNFYECTIIGNDLFSEEVFREIHFGSVLLDELIVGDKNVLLSWKNAYQIAV